MKVIFEDHRNALSSQLFRASYPDSSDFIYADGGGNIQGIVRDIWNKNSQENICIYLDTIPANPEIRAIYRELRKIAADHTGRMMIFPIVCSEYYVLKAFGNRENSDIDVCVQKGDYFHTDAFQMDPKGCRNFEKFCKYLLRNSTMDCLSTDSRNVAYSKFYTSDCLCQYSVDGCGEKSLLEKSEELLRGYMWTPSANRAGNPDSQEYGKLLDIHRNMVAEFNDFSDYLKKLDTRGYSYFHIKPIA